ncbi:MAG: FlgD immunoglobulin-like domain containing protein, partial [Candidatus Cloacimonas sp.]|nr:T9SS type A sorting domain-containing protein [Candidatus Cloacimonadota bacterium]
IDIFNSRGQKVKTLINDHLNAGYHKVEWNGKDAANKSVSSGIYFYRMQNGSYTASKKMILMK